jgi:CheY-like chemotaxis protein/anti-sigma regulatory factor (Ser/Thr protein kinase)
MNYKILAVDDELFNLDIIGEYLEEEGYQVIQAEDGVIALEKLEEHPDVDLIVLDRMMPNMDGMTVVNKLKEDNHLKNIPIVMQTAAAQKEQILEGIQAGVYYYLTKPYDKEIFLGIIRSALEIVSEQKKFKAEVDKNRNVLGLMESSSFKIRTLEDANTLSYFISNCLPDPAKGAYILKELFVNAVEHGNLGISYAEKKNLILEGKWVEEITSRLDLSENKDKYAYVEYKLENGNIEIIVTDQGEGFIWDDYIDISVERAMDPNGRGIATAKLNGALEIEYHGKGNIVSCKTKT